MTLVVSEVWVQNHQGSGGGGASSGEVQARIRALQQAIDRLREETHTGWVGRQDDVTGYLGELSGGSWPGTPAGFAEDYGADLFGVESSVLRFEDPDTVTVPNVTSTRATQAIGEVPVLDATLVFTGRGTGSGTGSEERVSGVRGRVFPGLTVDTTPTLTAEQATAAAAEASGGTTTGTSTGTPRLVVLPNQTGVLAWEVPVVGETTSGFGAGLYYLDATTGDLLDVRPASAQASAPLAAPRQRRGTQPDPNSVELSGTDPLGRAITAFGLQSAGGVELVDTTTQSWDDTARTGGVTTYDATGVRSESQLPGKLVVSPSTTVDDAEALAAQSYSHAVLDFYARWGRDSWDGRGGDLVSSVHVGGDSYCNAYFAGYLPTPQMLYGGPCIINGQQLTRTYVDPDLAGHEITHGVTASSAGLLYSGQSGALNESFSDYLGNVIGNRIHGKDDDGFAEDRCADLPTPSRACHENPDGSVSDRYLLNGATLDDYLNVLDPGLRLEILFGVSPQDSGGVHWNSAIWNNALWSIRTRLAQVDGQPGTTSPLVESFDRSVYGALTTRLTPTSGFVDARAAVEQVIIEAGLDPVVLRVAREVFDHNKICPGCPAPPELLGDVVSSAPQTQQRPDVSGDRVAWLDLSARNEVVGYAATAGTDGGTPTLSATADVVDVAFAGDAVVTLDANGNLTRTVGSDSADLETRLSSDVTYVAGLGGSDTGAAWLSTPGTVKYVDRDGRVSEADLGNLQGDQVTAVAAGGGTVAVGTSKGRVLTWTPGAGGFREIGRVPALVYDLATYAGNVLVLDGPQVADTVRTTLFRADGQQVAVTDQAQPFGAAMSSEYAVWSESQGPVDSPVAAGRGVPFLETDLYLLSLSTGKVYNVHQASGQQGFPALSGRRLVWQDAALGGDDIFTAVVPGGL